MPAPARTTVLPLPWTSQATPRRGEMTPKPVLILRRQRLTRANSFDRWSRGWVDVRIKVAQKVVEVPRGPVHLVAQAKIQRHSGFDPPVVLKESRIPVSAALRSSEAQENRAIVRRRL